MVKVKQQKDTAIKLLKFVFFFTRSDTIMTILKIRKSEGRTADEK